MRLTRWKLMAGVLGLSMCGLAALAEPACRSVGLTRRADDPKPAPDAEKPVEAAKPLPLPVPAPPSTTEVPPPVIPAVDDKKSAPLPTPAVTDAKPVPMPANDPKLPPAVDIKLLEEVAKTQNPPTPLPSLKEQPAATPAPVSVPAPVAPLPTPVQAATPPVPNHTPASPFGSPVLGTPTPIPVAVPDPVVPVKADIPPAPKVDVTPAPAPAPAPEAVKPAGAVSAKKLKVLLHLSDEKPWFEVRDGEDLVLKVTADAVNLAASAEKSKPAGVLVAAGGVTFRTLGGFGTCDELQVVPGTGEVVVTGKVAVTSNWGKAETTATADKMTFRLGTDAGKK